VTWISLQDGSLPCKAGIDLSKFLDRILDLQALIEQGKPIPTRYYRQSQGRDYLLEEEGWLHLHIGYGIDDDVLLIVEQTPTEVIFIAVTDHSIFREHPRGRSLSGLKSKIAKAKRPRT
jgi:hypothetical protein